MNEEKALEKIAKYQLPFPDAWVVKLGQGVVLSGAESLQIHQTGTDTVFEFRPAKALDASCMTSFFDPAEHPVPWWHSFRSSLWAVGLNLRRPFLIEIGGRGYFWDGFDLHDSGVSNLPERKVRLDISHRTAEQGKGFPIIRGIQAAMLNAHLGQVFSEVLFSCPLRVFLDGRRIDGFQRVSSHGFSSSNHPVRMFWLKGRPALKIPPATLENSGHFAGHSKLEALTHFFDSRPPDREVRAAALLSAHAYYQSGKNGGWRIPQSKSVLYWIRHGVVVQKEEFSLPAGSVSMAVFATCDHIKTDITGFGLEENHKQSDLVEICAGLNQQLNADRLDLVVHDRERHKALLKLAGGVAVSGLVLKFVFPPALFLAGAGGYGAILLTQTIAKVDSAINKDLVKLQDGWRRLSEQLVPLASRPGPV